MPFISRKEKRSSARFEMRLSAEEQARIREDADLAGLSVSEFVRRRALQKPIQAATDLTMIRELRRLGGLQKHTINKALHSPEVIAECVLAVKALQAAIERVGRDDR